VHGPSSKRQDNKRSFQPTKRSILQAIRNTTASSLSGYVSWNSRDASLHHVLVSLLSPGSLTKQSRSWSWCYFNVFLAIEVFIKLSQCPLLIVSLHKSSDRFLSTHSLSVFPSDVHSILLAVRVRKAQIIPYISIPRNGSYFTIPGFAFYCCVENHLTLSTPA